MTVSQQVKGMRLLDGAADAGQSASYQGTELISEPGVAGSVKLTSQVWHQSGGVTVVETPSAATSGSAQPAATAGVASTRSAVSEGVFGVTKSLVALLGQHYVALYRGGGAAVDRAASIVDLYRFDGSLAARYWLDTQTNVPLRRDLFDPADNLISEDSFIKVKFGAPSVPQVARAGVAKAQPAWVAAASSTGFVASLAGQGWQVPGRLAGGLPLYTASSAKTTSGEVVDLEYSDGLNVVSLFVQRGTLAASMPGWQPVSVDGQRAFASGHSVAWAVPGFVYTMIADASPQTVTQVVGGLRHEAAPGFLGRLGRGFTRLARAVNPFG
jgi:sigma-E factor negative regulatory protein RseB